jgi:pyruvate formate lyase activating enzyme
MHEARYYEKLDNSKVKCLLCPHTCTIASDKSGKCLIRKNINGKLIQSAYGQVCSASFDPIEKKPLYNYYPTRPILSIGTNGCNMRCHFCQNWNISTQETNRETTTPEHLLQLSKSKNSIGIAYTYNEPLIWYEFVYDCAKVFRDGGQKNVLVTNGQINSEPLEELLPLIDAANIDLKGYTEGFYKKEGGDLQTTKNTIEAMAKAGKHIELTNLLIPQLNDDEADFEEMCRFIASISKDIPLHISRYFPQYKSNQAVTSEQKMMDFRNIATKYLNYVFLGNVQISGESDTYCPNCKNTIIERTGYNTRCLVEDNKCQNCSQLLSIYL